MFRMQHKERMIMDFLDNYGIFITPTLIGRHLGCSCQWVCENSKRLLKEGYIIKNSSGRYRSKNIKIEGYSGDKRNVERIQDIFLYEVRP